MRQRDNYCDQAWKFGKFNSLVRCPEISQSVAILYNRQYDADTRPARRD